MAEKFGLNGEVKELKIGRTFEKNSGQSAFHTVRYDFKPASVDSSREGVLTVDENKSVSITVPHLHGNGQTNFSGRVKNANPKECILIIDRETGEITLETLSSQILVKKTRPERNPDPVLPDSGATSTPTNSNPPTQAAPFRTQMSVRKEKPPAVKPPGVKAPPVRPPPVKPPASVQRPSSPVFLGLPIKPEVILPTMTSQDQKKAPTGAAAVLSESSSSSDSSSDDSSSSSDSGSDNEDEKPRPASANVMSMPSFMSGGSTAAATSSQPSMPSFAAPSSASMPSFNLPSKTSNAPPQGRLPAPLPQRGTTQASAAPPAISMPQFLNDDLQLSESDDDSD